MHAADVYVMSSAWEGLPGALIEALACGARVVSTDCRTGPAEILEGGKWGKLVPVGNAELLALALQKTLNDPSPPEAQSRLKDFHPDQIIPSYEKVSLR